jgi:membrane protease YdiL (CAAX protease family)
MPFVSAWNASQLPEKPWKAGAVVRLVVSVLVSAVMCGGLAMTVLRYFETPQESSLVYFIALAAITVALVAVAFMLLARPWLPEQDNLFKLIGLLTCIYGGVFLTWMAGRFITGKIELQNPVFMMLTTFVTFQGAAVVLVHFFLREHRIGWPEGFGLNLRPTHTLLIGFSVGILALYPTWGLQRFSISLLEKLTYHPQAQQAVEILRHTEGMLERVALGIGTILIAPVGEELIFRGVLYPGVKKGYGKQVAMWSTALLFAAIHANLAVFLPLTFLAVILVWVYEYTGNLLAPIAVHCVFNAANFVELYAQQN